MQNPHTKADLVNNDYPPLCRLLFGFDQGLVSIVLVMPQFLSTFPQMNPSLTSSAGFNQG